MNSTQDFILDSLKEEPIGETDHFIWFVTDIGIVAVFNNGEDFNTFNQSVEIEAIKISLDITKEEREYFEICGKKLFLFYS